MSSAIDPNEVELSPGDLCQLAHLSVQIMTCRALTVHGCRLGCGLALRSLAIGTGACLVSDGTWLPRCKVPAIVYDCDGQR